MSSRRKRHGRPLAKQLRQGYRLLSLINTISWLLSGKPDKIVKHLARRKMVRKAGRLF